MSKEARWQPCFRALCALLWTLPCLVLGGGASFRTENFLVQAPTKRMAQDVALAAERQRKELALSWLGRELPPSRAICPVQVNVGDQLPPSGRTSFSLGGGQVLSWEMEVNGSWERILDSVLPHEVMHTVFATHFGRQLPRWADEGACTTVEHRSEKAKHQLWLVRYLQEGRGISFASMFSMRDYPEDILPLYAQGFSLSRFLIEQRGRQAFVQFLDQGLAQDDWREAVRAVYGYGSLGALQNAWLEWIRQGSPVLTGPESSSSPAMVASQQGRGGEPRARFLGQDPGSSLAGASGSVAAISNAPFRDDQIAPAAFEAPIEKGGSSDGQSLVAAGEIDVNATSGEESIYVQLARGGRSAELARSGLQGEPGGQELSASSASPGSRLRPIPGNELAGEVVREWRRDATSPALPRSNRLARGGEGGARLR